MNCYLMHKYAISLKQGRLSGSSWENESAMSYVTTCWSALNHRKFTDFLSRSGPMASGDWLLKPVTTERLWLTSTNVL